VTRPQEREQVRLTRLLAEMSLHTQVIIITHAKRTMETAQVLYGVTMQEPGVSKLVSVKFNPLVPPPLEATPGEVARA
jgi:chromosome segregation protein